MNNNDKDFHLGRVEAFYNQKAVLIPEDRNLRIGDYVRVKKVEK